MDKAIFGEGFVMNVPPMKAIVRKPFFVHIAETETRKHYIATDDFSPVFELGITPIDALIGYMKAVLDEMVWLEENVGDYYPPGLAKELVTLHEHIQIVSRPDA